MITRLRVRNFKSLKEIDLSLGSLNVLVGPNMAGKSNILDVLRFLFQVFFPEANTQGIFFAFAQRGGPSEVLWQGGDGKLITIALEAVDGDESGTRFQYELQILIGAGNFATIQNESLKLLREDKKGEGLEWATDLLLPQEGGLRRLANADGKHVGNTHSSGVSALQYASPDWDGYKFHEWVRSWRFYHLVPPHMKQPSQMSLGQVLGPNGDNLSAWLMWIQTHSPEAFGRINEVMHDLFPDLIQAKTIPTPDGNVHLAFQEKGLRRPTNVWQASDGFVVLAALLSLIYVPAELGGTLFCIEEPENHLHPKLLETLIALLRQVRQEIVDSKTSLTQIMMTTQSPYLVDQMSLDEVIWVEKKDGQTRAYRPADKGHLRKLVEDKVLGIGDLMFTGALGEEK